MAHVSSLDSAVLDEMVGTIVAECDPEQVLLFGSHARTQAAPDSDVDLLVVESGPFGPDGKTRREEAARIWNLLYSYRIPKDILVVSTQDRDRYRGDPTHVIGRAYQEGRVLYDKQNARG